MKMSDLEKEPTPLEIAVSGYERLFKTVKKRDEHSKDIPIVWSGGLTGLLDQPPVLYSDPDHAITSWRQWANGEYEHSVDKIPDGANDELTLEWIQRPELIEYQITIADKLGRHRMVNNRWAVKSQFKVSNG